jgi:L-amino acid N-acyltransferase YncA
VVTRQELIFRQLLTLQDGTRVLLRPLATDDKKAMIDLYSSVTFEERRYMHYEVRDEKVVGGWVDQLDHSRVLHLVAVIGDRIVGDATLIFGRGPERHRAQVFIFLAKDFRRRGLGNRMLQALIDIARQRNLYLLEAQIIHDQTSFIKAFQSLGFEAKCTIEDYFMPPDGELWNVVLMVLRLRSPNEEF